MQCSVKLNFQARAAMHPPHYTSSFRLPALRRPAPDLLSGRLSGPTRHLHASSASLRVLHSVCAYAFLSDAQSTVVHAFPLVVLRKTNIVTSAVCPNSGKFYNSGDEKRKCDLERFPHKTMPHPTKLVPAGLTSLNLNKRKTCDTVHFKTLTTKPTIKVIDHDFTRT